MAESAEEMVEDIQSTFTAAILGIRKIIADVGAREYAASQKERDNFAFADSVRERELGVKRREDEVGEVRQLAASRLVQLKTAQESADEARKEAHNERIARRAAEKDAAKWQERLAKALLELNELRGERDEAAASLGQVCAEREEAKAKLSA
jgi:hypothetical protein